MTSLRRVAGAVAVLLALAGCDTDDGRTLEPPPPGATAPPLATSTTATTANLGTPPVGSGEASSLVLSSSAFTDGDAIPARLSACDGEGLSPGLAWTGVPPETTELALTVIDPDAPGAPFVHWVVGGIDPVVTGFDEGGLPESAVEVRPWTGPCPPMGETHDYVVTLYALSEPAGMTAETGVEDALAALESTPGPTATLRGTYARPG
jgi:Raf kinase inhibitor-like YbhB/YbcL family protein